MIYVYTSIVDGFDNLRPPAIPAETFVRFICFTNVPNLPRVYPWEYRPALRAANPAQTSRVAKILPHLMLPADAEYSIYHDGNFQLRRDPQRIIEELLGGHDWAAHTHPARQCIYDEARIIQRDCPLVDSSAVDNEISAYRRDGYPAAAGLWANGFIVRRHTPDIALLNERWWELYSRGCGRDQLSFPVARRALGIDIATIQANIYASPYILFRWHAAFKTHEDNPDFWPEREQIRMRLNRLGELTGAFSGIDYSKN